MQDLAWLISIGFGIGILGGYLGIGGAGVLTPILLSMFRSMGVSDDVRYHLAFGTTMFAVIGTSISSAYSFSRHHLVYWPAVLWTGIIAVVFSLVGSKLAAISSAGFLKTFFVLFILGNVVMLLIPKPTVAPHEVVLHRNRLLVIGVITGLLSAYLGVAGGVVMVPLFILWAGVPTEMASGTSAAVGVLTTIVGMLGYIYHGLEFIGQLPAGAWGFVIPSVGIPIMIGTIAGAPLGSYFNRKLGTGTFKYIFVVFLLAVAIKMIFTK